jgi:PAS domain S-box-containing protein
MKRINVVDKKEIYSPIINPPKIEESQNSSNKQFYIKDDWYKAVVQSAMEGFCLLDIYGHILDVNQAFCNIHGYKYEEMISMKIQTIDTSFINNLEMYNKILNKVRNQGNYFSEVIHKHKEGIQ